MHEYKRLSFHLAFATPCAAALSLHLLHHRLSACRYHRRWAEQGEQGANGCIQVLEYQQTGVEGSLTA